MNECVCSLWFINRYLSSSKNAGLNGDWNPDLCDAGAVLYLFTWVDDKLIDDGYGCIYCTVYHEIHKLHILELWIEMDVYYLEELKK